MKKLVNTPLSNTIWWATVNENNGTMNTSTRVDVTDNAIQSVLDHIMVLGGFKENGFAGYTYNRKDNSGELTLCAIDSNKMKVVTIEDYNKLKENK